MAYSHWQGKFNVRFRRTILQAVDEVTQSTAQSMTIWTRFNCWPTRRWPSLFSVLSPATSFKRIKCTKAFVHFDKRCSVIYWAQGKGVIFLIFNLIVRKPTAVFVREIIKNCFLSKMVFTEIDSNWPNWPKFYQK